MAPRRSKRNILAQLEDVQVDVSGKGATVSDEIQLTYLLDDLRSTAWVTGGTGIFKTAFGANQHGSLQITCRNRRGLLINELIMVKAAGANTALFAIKINPAPGLAMTAETILTSALGAPVPLALVRSGAIDQAIFTGDRVTMGDATATAPGWAAGLKVNAGQTLAMMADDVNKNSLLSMIWTELDQELAE